MSNIHASHFRKIIEDQEKRKQLKKVTEFEQSPCAKHLFSRIHREALAGKTHLYVKTPPKNAIIYVSPMEEPEDLNVCYQDYKANQDILRSHFGFKVEEDDSYDRSPEVAPPKYEEYGIDISWK